MKRQVVVIHGGKTFDSYEEYIDSLKTREVDIESFKIKKDWKDNLQNSLGDYFEVIQPRMPNGNNAQYIEWKIWFERLAQFLNDEVIFVGHSLGGIFLAKYLSENDFSKKIKATFLVATPFDVTDMNETLGKFKLPPSLEKFKNQGGRIYLVNSKDDEVVPFSNCMSYQKVLPNSRAMIFEGRQHFNQEDFPEIVAEIKNIGESVSQNESSNPTRIK